MANSEQSTRDHRNEPTYWFAVLEIARERGDFHRAAVAKQELERLGVRISYEKPQHGRGATNAVAIDRL